MAINISTDIAITSGGKLSDITAIQGGWQTLPSASNMNALTASAILKGKLNDGQIFYIESSNEIYKLNITGTFPLVNYNFEEFAWPGSGAGAVTGSTNALNTFSGSIQSQVNTIAAFTGSIQNEVNSIKQATGSFAGVSGENNFVGNQNIAGNLIVTGDLTAERYIVSSSVTFITQSFSSGSTIFGDSLDDTHLVTGSLNITGSFFLNNKTIAEEVGTIFKQTGSFFSATSPIKITGSLGVSLAGSSTFNVSVSGKERFQVNSEGVVVLGKYTSTPTAVTGGFFYSSSNEFYVGM